MKRKIYLTLFTILLAAPYFTSCNWPAKMVDNKNTQEENKDKNQSETEFHVMKIATAEEWIVFKEDQELKIKNNDLQIAYLRKVIASETGHKIDSLFQKIIELQQKNNILRAKIISYETNQTDWVTFKRKVDNDLLELDKEFNNLSAVNIF